MSFYGNIINYFTKSFKTIGTDNGSIDAQTFNDTINIVGDNEYIKTSVGDDGIQLQFLKDTTDTLYNIYLQEDATDTDDDNKLVYVLMQNDSVVGRINIPLDLILDSASIETKNDKNVEGVYLHLVFKTEEIGKKDVYIDVHDLYEIVGSSNDDIEVTVSDENVISAKLTDKVKKTITDLQYQVEVIQQQPKPSYSYISDEKKLIFSNLEH